MKKFLIGLAIFLGLILAILISVPHVAQYYINEKLGAQIHRKVHVDDVSLNIFTWVLSIENLSLQESDSTETFISLSSLTVDIDLLPLLTSEIRVKEVTLIDPSIQIVREADGFNFDDLLQNTADTTKPEDPEIEEPKDTSKPGFLLNLENFSIQNGQIAFYDNTIDREVVVREFSIDVPKVILDGSNTHVDIGFNLETGGHLDLSADYTLASGDFEIDFSIEKFNAKPFEPYLQDQMNVQNFGGFLSTQLFINGNSNTPLESKFEGWIDLDSLHLENLEDEVLVDLASARFKILPSDAYPVVLNLDTILIEKPAFDFVQTSERNTYSNLIPEKPADTALVETTPTDTTSPEKADTLPPQVNVNYVFIKNGQGNILDRNYSPAFKYQLSEIQVKGTDFSLENPGVWTGNIRPEKRGSVDFSYSGTADMRSRQDIKVDIHKIDLRPFSAMTIQLFGYPIEKGLLSYDSKNQIRNSYLTSNNDIRVYDLNFGEDVPGANPEYKNMPVKTGLFLMEDKNKTTQLDLKVEGNIDDPDFSFSKLIFKALSNVLVKVVSSPVKFVNSSIKGDKIQNLEFSYQDFQLTSKHQEAADKLVDLLKENQNTTLLIRPVYPYQKTLSENKEVMALVTFYKSRENVKGQLDDFDKKAIQELKQNKDFKTFLENALGETDGSLSTKELIDKFSSDEAAQKETNRRINQLTKRLQTELISQGISGNRIVLIKPTEEELKNAKKSQWEFGYR